ncbi:hypothetical protein BC629DRAFT_1553290 [Irpex lacteus]|nr:hypothetical protein BC629DRAFT_1553290 [Irpex lacteus]
MSLSTSSHLASALMSKIDCDRDCDVSDNRVDLYTLPDDVLLHVISYPPVKSIVTSRKRLYHLTEARCVWVGVDAALDDCMGRLVVGDRFGKIRVVNFV